MISDALLSTVLVEMLAHAERDFPRESCGLLVVVKGRCRYLPCRNIAERNEHFVLSPDDYGAAEDKGEVVAVVHSHCNLPPIPSQADLVGCEKSGVPWIIVSWPTAQVKQIEPSGYVAPLYGREFSHGILDCYSLIRDYYMQNLNIQMSDYARDDEWWLKAQNLYLDNFEEEGFVVVNGQPEVHDLFLMQMMSAVPNHAAVYVGDGLILHHAAGRLSSRDVYGGWYQKITTHQLRHRSLL